MYYPRPTFQFFKSGQKVAELKGASAGQIEQLVKKHQGDGNSAGGSSSGSGKNNYGIPGHVSGSFFLRGWEGWLVNLHACMLG